MATIREMAENSSYPTLAEKVAYWDGANAVLKEIEKALVYPKNDGQRIMIEKKIKELKGK